MGTPTVSSGAETMKTINSTSITSTNGVTLISLITLARRCRRLPTATPPPVLAAAIPASRAFVDLPRQDRGELVGETLEPLCLLVHLGDELVIENGRRDGSNQANCGREQGLRDTRRHDCQRSVLGGRDRLKAGHDAPNGAEKTNERPGRPD